MRVTEERSTSRSGCAQAGPQRAGAAAAVLSVTSSSCLGAPPPLLFLLFPILPVARDRRPAVLGSLRTHGSEGTGRAGERHVDLARVVGALFEQASFLLMPT